MNNPLERYKELQDKLAYIRWLNLGHESVEEDELLEDMDDVWWDLSTEEKEYLSSLQEGKTPFLTDDSLTPKMIDIDLNKRPGPPRSRI